MKISEATTNNCTGDRPWLNVAALRYWSFHVFVSAAPGFLFGLSMSPKPERVLGMLLGVVFFIVLYTACARWTYPQRAALPLWRRAIRLGTWIRTGCALLCLLVFLLGTLGVPVGNRTAMLLFMPDFMAGLMASHAIEALRLGDMGAVLPTFLTTVLAGFILSAWLFVIAFVCLGVLKLVSLRQARSIRV